MIKFRFHRGGFKESIETCTSIESYHDLCEHIFNETGFSDISFKYTIFDERCGWDTWYVCFGKYKDVKTKGVIGMSNAALIPLKGELETGSVWLYDKQLNPILSQLKFNHSPNGFSWGYSGSGPAQLALSICMSLYDDPMPYYQKFKQHFIAELPQKDFITELKIEHEGLRENWVYVK